MNRYRILNSIGSGGGTSTDTPSMALRIPADRGHVNHGYFWEQSQTYTRFLWEGFTRPFDLSTVGYLISAGYGGNHNILLGFDSTATHFKVTGNIWDGDSAVTFESDRVFKLGDWVYVAAAWDLSNLYVYVNGVCEGVTAYSALNRSTAGVSDSTLFIGGSDHSKFDLDVAWVRGFEDVCPATVSLGAPFRPHRWPTNTFYNSGFQRACFLADYTRPARVIPDLSDGLNGIRHAGILEGSVTATGAFADANQTHATEAQKPYWVTADFSEPTHDTEAVPEGALIFDGFNRHSCPFWDNTPTLGSTEGGSLGVKAWTNATSYGTSYGRAYPVYSSPVIARVDAESLDVSTRFTLNNGKGDFYVRYADADNYIVFSLLGAQQTLTKRIAGVNTQLYQTFGGATATSVRIDTNGNTITAYVNGANVHSETTALPTGTEIGFATVSNQLSKVDSVEVQPV